MDMIIRIYIISLEDLMTIEQIYIVDWVGV